MGFLSTGERGVTLRNSKKIEPSDEVLPGCTCINYIQDSPLMYHQFPLGRNSGMIVAGENRPGAGRPQEHR